MNYYSQLGELLTAEHCTSSRCPHHCHAIDVQDPLRMREAAYFRSLYRSKKCPPIGELARHVGHSADADLVIGLLLSTYAMVSETELLSALRDEIAESLPESDRIAALLDIGTDNGLALLEVHDVNLLLASTANPLVRRAGLRHLSVLGQNIAHEWLRETPSFLHGFGEALHWMLSASLIGLSRPDILDNVRICQDDLVRYVPQAENKERSGITVMQFALWGSFGRPGEGDSGGLSVFLSSLGDALAQEDGIGQVITVTHATEEELLNGDGWLEDRGNGHQILRIPTMTPDIWSNNTLSGYSDIDWWLRMLLPPLALVPDVAHVRFGTNLTLKAAKAVRSLGCHLAFTIAPDPHRTILEANHAASGGIDVVGMDRDLHRVFIAELLAEWAQAPIAIPSAYQEGETRRFFPELATRFQSRSIPVIPEGIVSRRTRATDSVVADRLISKLYEPDAMDGLGYDSRELTVLLNVGRWNRLKQQDVLVEAWLDSGLWESSVLVSVGGNIERPGEVERSMRQRVRRLLLAAPAGARKHFAWLSALSNDEVRILEHALSDHFPNGPHVYVCSSLKEEFGIAVLEAMEAGLLVVAPRRGGCSHYIKPGTTGFLMDTSSAWAISADLSAILGQHRSRQEEYLAISVEGRRVVRNEFQIEMSARKFATQYMQLM